jgi:hypothetical protein
MTPREMKRRTLLLRLQWAANGNITLADIRPLFREAARALKRLTPKPTPRRLR